MGIETSGELLQRLSGIQEGLVLVVQPPPISGIGNAGGFRMMVEDRQSRGSQALVEAASAMMSRVRMSMRCGRGGAARH